MKLFVTKDQAPAPAPAAPAQVVVAPPAPSGMNLKDITEFMRAVPPVVWEKLLSGAPKQPAQAAPAQSAFPQGAVMVASDGPVAPRAAPAAPAPAITAAQQELVDRIGRLKPDERKELAKGLLDMLPDEILLAKLSALLPTLVSDEHALMANVYMSANLPQSNPPK